MSDKNEDIQPRDVPARMDNEENVSLKRRQLLKAGWTVPMVAGLSLLNTATTMSGTHHGGGKPGGPGGPPWGGGKPGGPGGPPWGGGKPGGPGGPPWGGGKPGGPGGPPWGGFPWGGFPWGGHKW